MIWKLLLLLKYYPFLGERKAIKIPTKELNTGTK